VQIWDATSGKISLLPVAIAGKNIVSFPLILEPHESRFIVVGPTR